MPTLVKVLRYQHEDSHKRMVDHAAPLLEGTQQAQTIGELMEHLRQFDPNLPIVKDGHYGYGFSIGGVLRDADTVWLDESADLKILGPFVSFY